MQLNENNEVWNYYKYLSLITLVVSFLFFLSLLNFFKHIDFIINLFNSFEKINLVNIFQRIDILAVLLPLIAYFSFFEYIKKKGKIALNDDGKESKYFAFILSFYGIFNFAILIPFILYLFFIKNAIFESVIIFTFYLISKYVFIPFMKTYMKIIFDYHLLSGFDLSIFKNEFKIETDKVRSEFTKNFEKLKKRDFYSIDKKYIYQYVKPLMKGVVWYILLNISLILKTIFILTFFVAFFGFFLGFNILSIIYVELTLIIWYFIISASSYLPRKAANISLNDGKKLKNVYIIEDFPNDYFLFITQENEVIKIMKSSVKTIG